MKDERYSPEEAAQHAQQHARPNGQLSHHLRCDWVKGEVPDLQRCLLASEHMGEHNYSTDAPLNRGV
jgi:hypothetical protein